MNRQSKPQTEMDWWKYERSVNDYINTLANVKSEHPDSDPTYCDLKITFNNITTWMEVKMNHKDNLGNQRAICTNGVWSCSRKKGEQSPIKDFIENQLNSSIKAKEWLVKVGLNSTDTIRNGDCAKILTEYALTNLQYIIKPFKVENIGKIVSKQYNIGKSEPAYYIQSGDDFYMLGGTNPLELSNDIPLFEGDGTFGMRYTVRGRSKGVVWNEIQPEFKIDNLISSKYSIKPGTNKLNPFI